MRSPALLIAAGCGIQVLNLLSFATYPTLLPELQVEWRLSNTEAGWISGIYFAGYVLAVALLTSLTDRVDPKRIYIASMAVSVIAPVGFALAADGLWSASLWRLLQGIGLAGTYMPGLRILTDQLPDGAQSRGVAFYTASFSIGVSASYYLSGLLAPAFGWQWAFAATALGPVGAMAVAAFVFESRPVAAERPTSGVLDFRPVIANRSALAYTLAYAAHNAELFAFRSWLVAFLVFSQGLQAGGGGLGWTAATLMALISLASMPASILGNELAVRFDRQRYVVIAMLISAAVGCAFGFLAANAFWIVVAAAVLYMVTISSESSAVTAGVVHSAEPRFKGATMAMHSVIGFIGALIGPLVFGVVLDLGGGSRDVQAWGLAFAAMSGIMLLGPLALVRLIGLRARQGRTHSSS